ncbi:MAG TPA: hypothetical protein VFL94_16030 [Actinomycetales bacterium]|nr:hypothetical protein [Actinomycetales bacterium]
MPTSSGARPRHLPTSPFQRGPEPEVEQYELDDLVSHDSHGVGRVIRLEGSAVVVDFGATKVRVMSPFRRLTKL